MKLSMIHKKIQEKNHQNWWTYIDWKIAAKSGKNQSPKTVKISMNPQKILQKCHQNWWKSDGFTRICTNFVENQVGLLYEKLSWIEERKMAKIINIWRQKLSNVVRFFFHNHLTFSKNVKLVQNFQHWPNMSKLSKIKNRGECPSLSTLSKKIKNCQNYQYLSKFV